MQAHMAKRCISGEAHDRVQIYIRRLSTTWPRARLWSKRVRQVMFSAGMEGAFSFKMSAFVLAGLATTSTCTIL